MPDCREATLWTDHGMVNGKLLPQIHVCGVFKGRQPYLRHNASLNVPLRRAKPCLAIGITDNQLEAHFSWERLSRFNCLVHKQLAIIGRNVHSLICSLVIVTI